MAPKKRPAPSKASGQEAKRKKTVMKLDKKVETSRYVEEGKSYAAVGHHFKVNESTVRYIKKKENEIRKSVSMTYYGTAKAVSTVRDKTIVKMESALSFWIKDCRKKNVPLDSNIIRQKARQIYQQLSTPTASQGGERISPRTGVQYGRNWPVLEENAVPDVPYEDEAKASGFKAQKDRVILLMCGNAAGFMLKPGLIYKAANPRALKNKNKALLPVFWMHNPKAWITKVLTEYWFHKSFIPQVRQYLADLDINFKVLLIMDNAGGHPLDLYSKGVPAWIPSSQHHLSPPAYGSGVIRALQGTLHRKLPPAP
ncbi:tigger transposable element-derived protein 1-like [Macrobrachium nipponense]|uniref:tigger transposable element-derived protein 1-like n=1 Tax=Macrobrachium nipponense TaxID=159736 RepID=UPI0030C89CF2